MDFAFLGDFITNYPLSNDGHSLNPQKQKKRIKKLCALLKSCLNTQMCKCLNKQNQF